MKKKKKVKRGREHKKRTWSRDRYPEDRRRSRRDRSLTRYCMTETTIVGVSYTALSIWTRSNLWSRATSSTVIYMKTPRRIFPSHSPDFCVESLVRSLARARERSILLRRGSLIALASPPHLATPNVHANGVVSTASQKPGGCSLRDRDELPPRIVRANSIHRRAN